MSGTFIRGCIKRYTYNETAAIKNSHRYFNNMLLKKGPLSIKQNPKKNARSPRKKPCHVIAYNSYGLGFTSNASTLKAAITSSKPKGLLNIFFIQLTIFPFSFFFM